MTRLAAIDCGEDHVEAHRRDDGTVELARTYRAGRVERIEIAATDTLRIAAGTLTVVSRCGASTSVTRAGATAELAAFAEVVAVATGCAISHR